VPALLSIIVPVYNESSTIAAVIERLRTVPLPLDREIIVVNDGSTDGTRAALEALEGIERLTIVHVSPNRGKGHAVRVGLAQSQGTITAIQDADLELDPSQLAMLVAPILRGDAVVVYGSRFMNRTAPVPFMTRCGNAALTWLTNALYGQSLTDMETCYKIMRGDVARSLTRTADRFDIEPEITAQLLRRGHRIREMPISFSPRSRAAGKKIRWRDGFQAVRVLIRQRFTRVERHEDTKATKSNSFH
jgi:glycosyltransferase involved in cell wall biosynthesis